MIDPDSDQKRAMSVELLINLALDSLSAADGDPVLAQQIMYAMFFKHSQDLPAENQANNFLTGMTTLAVSVAVERGLNASS